MTQYRIKQTEDNKFVIQTQYKAGKHFKSNFGEYYDTRLEAETVIAETVKISAMFNAMTDDELFASCPIA